MVTVQGIKNYFHFLEAFFANLYFGFPSRKLFVIGVTGTNGKTTVVQMIAKILEEAGYKVGISSTINFGIGEKKWVNKTKFTSVSSWAQQKFLTRCLKARLEFVITEVSSHALDQNRTWGTDYDIGVITNVTREHLDYHKKIKEYRRTKRKLFEYLERKKVAMKNGRKTGFSVVNLDMQNPQEFMLGDWKKVYGYQIKEAKDDSNLSRKIGQLVQAEEVRADLSGSQFKVFETEFNLKLPGVFNVENALAAICVGRILGIDNDKMKKALGSIKGIPGRMEQVPNNKGINIIIDYALTPDSMEKVGKLMRESLSSFGEAGSLGNNTPSRLIWVFGSCGQRDRGKRPIMGEIVAKYANLVIVTNEDPYHEDPQQIINEVFDGVVGGKNNSAEPANANGDDEVKMSKTEGKNAFKITDRREAIEKAIKEARTGDVVLITGKGAEENMKIGNKLVPWNDKRVVKEVLGR